MCGLTAIFASIGDSVDLDVLKRMTSAIGHRGPDDEGVVVDGRAGFGFRRLSILDLTASAHQPMLCPTGRYLLVFNGEIYNYVELRDELSRLGHRFSSSGDTEVLLHAFLQWGLQTVDRLNGMWAFLIYDRQEKRLFGSRDRFGKKPLYYHRTRSALLFASEIKSIVASGQYQAAPNWDVSAAFLLRSNLNECSATDQTFYADIFQVPPGSIFEVDSRGQMLVRRFWTLPMEAPEPPFDAAERFGQIFDDAVRIRLRSDVPVGVFLSGGLDSTSVLCSAARSPNMAGSHTSAPLTAISYHTPEYDESSFVDETVRETQAALIRFETTPGELWAGLERFLWFQDEPVHSFAALIYFELCRIAAENGIKVILAGGGADEYLAGYFTFFRIYWTELALKGEHSRLRAEVRLFASIHGSSMQTLLRETYRAALSSWLKRQPGLALLAARRADGRLRRNSWFTPELTALLPATKLEPAFRSLNDALVNSVESHPLPLYLREDDRSSMAHGVEARSPFLDHRLVSMAFGLPASWKLRGPWNKHVLREAMRRQIPENVRSRPDKMGFSIPRRQWFADVLFEPMRDLIHSAAFRERGIYHINSIDQDLRLHAAGRVDCADRLFNLLQFELWYRNSVASPCR